VNFQGPLADSLHFDYRLGRLKKLLRPDKRLADNDDLQFKNYLTGVYPSFLIALEYNSLYFIADLSQE